MNRKKHTDLLSTTALNEKLREYLKAEGLIVLDSRITTIQLKNVVLRFVDDFLNYNLSFDNLSLLFEKVLEALQKSETKGDSELFTICHYGAELNWYIRNDPGTATRFLEIIVYYYVNVVLESYYDWANVELTQSNLSLEEAEKIGTCMVQDFVNDRVSAKQLSLICNHLYPKMHKDEELRHLYFNVSRSAVSHKEYNSVNEDLESLLNYFGFDSNCQSQ